MEANKQLNVGDKIYERLHYGPLRLLQIDRVTNTMAISGMHKFKRDVSGTGYVRLIGGSSYSRLSYYLETEELNNRYEKQVMCDYILNGAGKTALLSFPASDLKQVVSLINKLKSSEGQSGPAIHI